LGHLCKWVIHPPSTSEAFADGVRNQWSGMFGSRSTDVGSQLPLWAVQDDFKPGVNTVTTFMGGWTSAVAKQYNLGGFRRNTSRT
jgi:hypothetical protein